ncbi:MAG: ABC transporter permease, partial [Verrucomicrobiota bacterium]
WRREVVRFFRQPGRVVGALATPLLLWFFAQSGFGSSFHLMTVSSDMNYGQYFFPGTVMLMILFTAIFSNISVIQDRSEGFLQAVLASPVPRSAIVIGKLAGGMTLSVLQGALILLIAPWAGIPMTWETYFLSLLVLMLTGFVVTGLGFLVAWPSTSVQGFHAVMNLFLMPMWLLSGAAFPAESAAIWMRWIMEVNPMYYGFVALQRCLYPENHPILDKLPTSMSCFILLMVSSLVLTVACTVLVRRYRVIV